MYVDLRDGWLWLTFPYKPQMILLVRTLPGRVFHRASKKWAVPCWNVEAVVTALAPLGFTFTGAVQEYRALLREHRRNLDHARANPEAYAGFLKDVIFPFQRCGATFLKVAGSALLADGMGLGKTIQTIAAAEGLKRVLVFCPSSNKYGWRREIEAREPGAVVSVIDGPPQDRARYWKYPGAKWFIVNYELLLRPDDLQAMTDGPWDMIVCDEATRISNGKAKTVKALKTIAAKRKIALTGTPISNAPDDLWSIIDWISPGFLGTYRQFLDQYAIFDTWGNIARFTDLKGLGERVRPFMLRRTKEEVLKELPKKTIEDIVFDLSVEEAKVYRAVRDNLLAEIDAAYSSGMDRRTLGILPVKMLRLKQVTGHLQLIGEKGESTKLKVLVDLLREAIAGGEKAIVFTQFAEMAKLIITRLEAEGWQPLTIMGEVSSVDRQAAVEAFQADAAKKVIVMTEAGAYGLNLQAASVVVHYDAPWSVAKLLQREDRAHRIGQERPVTVYNLVAKGTIDEYVAKVLHKKHKYSNEILGDVERLEQAGLEKDDIMEILRL